MTLANGKLLPGGREQDLTKMTLDQIDAMQSGMLHHPGNKWNSSASGRYQIVQKTLRGLRRQLGLKGSELFDEKMQDRLGATLARQRGANGSLGSEWASLRGQKLSTAIGLLGQVPKGSSTTPGDRPADAASGGDAVVPSPTGNQYAGLRTKGGQATGGGASHVGVTDLARQLQASLPGGVKHFGAFNDHYHHRVSPNSKHAKGLAFDTSLKDPSQSAAAASAIRNKLLGAGLSPKDFMIQNEYLNPSPHSTGGHIHTQFNSPEAAKRYQDYVAAQAAKAAGNKAASGGGWQRGAGGNAAALGLKPETKATVASATGTAKDQAAAIGAGARIAAAAASKVGLHEERDEAKLKRWVGSEVKGDVNPWCAAFVNAALRDGGVRGTGSKLAASFSKWGKSVDMKDVKEGDVLYRPQHFGVPNERTGVKHAHAAVATGETRINPETGKHEVEAYTGNSDDEVKKKWYESENFQARRSAAAMAKQSVTPSAAARSVGGENSPQALAKQAGGAGLAKSVPLPPSGPVASIVADNPQASTRLSTFMPATSRLLNSQVTCSAIPPSASPIARMTSIRG